LNHFTELSHFFDRLPEKVNVRITTGALVSDISEVIEMKRCDHEGGSRFLEEHVAALATGR